MTQWRNFKHDPEMAYDPSLNEDPVFLEHFKLLDVFDPDLYGADTENPSGEKVVIRFIWTWVASRGMGYWSIEYLSPKPIYSAEFRELEPMKLLEKFRIHSLEYQRILLSWDSEHVMMDPYLEAYRLRNSNISYFKSEE
jgi:hypothetical protein